MKNAKCKRTAPVARSKAARNWVRTSKPRDGWAEQAKEANKRGEDILFDDVSYPLSTWDNKEWEW
jgi:hypothetical protein